MSRLRRKEGVEILQGDNSPPSRKTTERIQTNEGIDSPRNTFGYIGKLIRKLIVFFCVLYWLILLLVYVSSTLRHQLIYLNYFVNPFTNYTHPAVYQLSSTRNFYIQGNVGKLGVWLTLAEGSTSISDGKAVVLYMHGNGYSRVAKHRIAIYKVLSTLGCHVVAHDYRGFGDSDGIPTEEGLTDDSLATFQWILANTNNSPVFLWGHSLGSAVAVAVSKILTAKDVSVQGLILEAPFNNLTYGASNHPLAIPYKFLPFFKYTLQEINDMFKSDEKISSVNYNILIIHDHTDKIIEIKLGKKLYEAALKHKKDNQLIEFREFRGFGHTYLHASPDLPGILRKFMKLETTIEEER